MEFRLAMLKNAQTEHASQGVAAAVERGMRRLADEHFGRGRVSAGAAESSKGKQGQPETALNLPSMALTVPEIDFSRMELSTQQDTARIEGSTIRIEDSTAREDPPKTMKQNRRGETAETIEERRRLEVLLGEPDSFEAIEAQR